MQLHLIIEFEIQLQYTRASCFTSGASAGQVTLAVYAYVSPFTIGQVIPVPQAFVGLTAKLSQAPTILP